MKKQLIRGLVAGVAGIVLLVGGVATASNMGFKFVPNIPANGAFNLSLPWNNNYTDAASLFDDIATAGTIGQVTKFESNGSLSSWQGPGSFTTNFPVVKGEAYLVYGGASVVNPVIVGSHDPNYTFTFAPGASNAAAPYHQTYVDAAGLFDAIAATCPGSLSQVTKFESNGSLSSWQGPGSFTTNFPLTLGEGVLVYTTANCSGFVWAHY